MTEIEDQARNFHWSLVVGAGKMTALQPSSLHEDRHR